MHFCFAGLVVLAKQHVRAFLQKRLTVKTELRTAKHVMFVIPAFLLIMEAH